MVLALCWLAIEWYKTSHSSFNAFAGPSRSTQLVEESHRHFEIEQTEHSSNLEPSASERVDTNIKKFSLILGATATEFFDPLQTKALGCFHDASEPDSFFLSQSCTLTTKSPCLWPWACYKKSAASWPQRIHTAAVSLWRLHHCSQPAVRTIWHMAWTKTTMGTSRGTIMCIPFVVLH